MARQRLLHHAAAAAAAAGHGARRRSRPTHLASSSSSSSSELRSPRPRTTLLVFLLIAAAVTTGANAQNRSQYRTSPPRPLRICVVNSVPALSLQPGVSLADGAVLSAADASAKLQGVAIDIINTVFGQILQWQYSVTYFDLINTGFSKAAYNVRMGTDCDLAVQSFFIAAARDLCLPSCPSIPTGTTLSSDDAYEKYLCCLDFSYPFYNGGWSFMSQVSTSAQIDYLNVFFQRDIVQAICVCIIVLFFMAHLIWLIERTQYGKSILLTNPKEGFSKYYLDGLKDGVWFSSTTLMNGVVNAEKTIITPFGRLVTTTWVLFGILMSAFVTAVIAASLTTAQLTTSALMTASDVAGKTVCTSSGFFSTFFDSSFPGIGIQRVLVENIPDCFPMVTAGTVDAAFSIREQALGYFAAGQGAGLVIAPIVKPQAYGMVWPQGWMYADWVNEALLLWQQNVVATQPPYADSMQRWYFGDSHEITYGGNVEAANQTWNWGLIGTAMALVVAYMSLQCFVMVTHWHMRKQGPDGPSVGGASSQKSFFMRAATAIAAPPDSMRFDGGGDAAAGDCSFHARGGASMRGVGGAPARSSAPEGSARLSRNGGALSPRQQQHWHGGGGAVDDAAVLLADIAAIVKRLDAMQGALVNGTPLPPLSPQVSITIAPAGGSPMSLEPAKTPTPGPGAAEEDPEDAVKLSSKLGNWT